MEHGYHHDAHEMLLGMMWKYLDEDQVRALVLRMIDSRIKMKQHWVARMQDMIGTYRMPRAMIRKGRKKQASKIRNRQGTHRMTYHIVPLF